jgi:hypothetical protein
MYRHVVLRKWIDVSKEHVSSICSAKEQAKRETSVKQVKNRALEYNIFPEMY